MDKMKKNSFKYDIKVQSNIHKNVYHTIRVDLFCHENAETEQDT